MQPVARPLMKLSNSNKHSLLLPSSLVPFCLSLCGWKSKLRFPLVPVWCYSSADQKRRLWHWAMGFFPWSRMLWACSKPLHYVGITGCWFPSVMSVTKLKTGKCRGVSNFWDYKEAMNQLNFHCAIFYSFPYKYLISKKGKCSFLYMGKMRNKSI